MFYSKWAKRKFRVRQKSQRAIVKLSRALRAEVLEGRMMLSVASPVPSYAWQSLSFGSEVGQQTFMLSPEGSVAKLMPVEGGFVLGDRLTTNYVLSGTVVAADYDLSSPTIADLLTNGSPLSTHDTIQAWANYDMSGTGGFVPRVVSAASIEPALLPVTQSDPHESSATMNPPEGGMIAIKPIAGPSKPIEELEGAESSLTKSLRRAQATGLSSSPDAPSSARGITGEWARAVVFEIAGGEPIADSPRVNASQSEPIAAHDQISGARPAAPSAAIEDTGSASRILRKVAAKQVSMVDQDSAGSEPVVGVSTPSAIECGIFGAQLQTAMPLNERDTRSGAIVTPSDAQPVEAVEAAFDRLGDGEYALPSASTDRTRPHSWLSGTPLLLMFALERVAARNSRRRRATDAAVEVVRTERPH
jgi:hypothetical protein